MKNVKVTLSVFAFLFAIAGAFASRAIVAQTGYERVQIGAQVTCEDRGECDTQGSIDCKFRKPDGSLVELYSQPTGNCGIVLKHSMDNGIINPAR